VGLIVHSLIAISSAKHLLKLWLFSKGEKKKGMLRRHLSDSINEQCLAAKQNLRWHFSFKQLFYFRKTLLKRFHLIANAF
jgi:hypothetical protein